MNWRISALDKYNLISNSDAHSLQKIGREVNVFNTELSYNAIMDALKSKDNKRFSHTIEFFPEEGKYHYDGHRACNLCYAPSQTKRVKGMCPVCNKPLTIGVMHRVEELADRAEGFIPQGRQGFKSLIPLNEIIASVCKKGVATKTVSSVYENAINYFGTEFNILLHSERSDLEKALPQDVAEAVLRVRQGDVQVSPGYDGVYGKIIFRAASRDKQGKREYQKELV